LIKLADIVKKVKTKFFPSDENSELPDTKEFELSEDSEDSEAGNHKDFQSQQSDTQHE
jgi:hypothetical protein